MLNFKQTFKTRTLAVVALLIAANIVLSRFCSINMWNLRIGFTFITPVLAAYFFGPIEAVLVAGLGDLVGALLFPTGGAYFPGFTLTAVLTGLCFGVFLHKNISLSKIIASVALNEFIGSLLLNTYWIHLLYGSPYKAIFFTRLTAQVIPMFIVEVIVIQVVFGKSMAVERIKKTLVKS